MFRITLTQGLNRQIRRMCRACGYDTVSIKRIRVANILLGHLNPGDIRAVTGEERRELYERVARQAQRPAKGGQQSKPAPGPRGTGQRA